MVEVLNQSTVTYTVSVAEANYSHRFWVPVKREQEFEGLIHHGVFRSAQKDEAVCHEVVRLSFVDKVRYFGTPQGKYKSLLMANAYNDTQKGIFTYAPTVLRHSQSIVRHVAA